MKLISFPQGGSTHATCTLLNTLGLAEHVISVQYNGAGGTVAILKVPDDQVQSVWRKLGRPPETCPIPHTN